jgi:hypothetical protein
MPRISAGAPKKSMPVLFSIGAPNLEALVMPK